MKTDDLIGMLATQAGPVRAARAGPRLAQATAGGLGGALAVLLLGYGLRPGLAQDAQLPMFWVKLLIPVCVAGAGGVLAARLGRPGVAARGAWWGVVVPVVAIWLLAAVQWVGAAPADRPALLWGQTWRTCIGSIGLIALPVFVAALAALRDLAPTRAAWAGAAAGALAGGCGAAVYALHCPELTAPFLAVWYVAGMALPVALGAVIGPRVLRW